MISNSLEDTKKLAHEFASTLHGGDVVFLEGDLGVGKTTFVQGVMEAFDYKDPVRSPTFSIMNIYPIQNHPTIRKIIHLDFYRFETAEEVQSLGLDELIADPSNTFLIEWPEKGFANGSVPHYTHRITVRSLDERTREIIIL